VWCVEQLSEKKEGALFMTNTISTAEEEVKERLGYKSPYEQWKESEGLPTYRGLFVKNLHDLELAPWRSSGGGLAAFLNLEGTGGFNDSYVAEIPPGKSLKAHRHLFEETIYILKGQGATSVWIDPGRKETFEWQEGSYFSIPMNAWHEHHNASGLDAARYIAMTSAPRVIDTFNNYEFVFENPFVFRDRYNAEEGYFKQKSPAQQWSTNFVADVRVCQTYSGGFDRGGGAKSTVFRMVNNTVKSHVSLWGVGAYKKAHRHGPGIHVLIIRGHGYSLMWQEAKQWERIDWGPGSVFVPPEMWFHQHFNGSAEPVFFLAIGWGSDKPKAGGKAYVYKSVKEGGDQIEYEDEDPKIHAEFETAMKGVGARCKMDYHPHCTMK
jgi:quercetin dioxygenase-like cupin family protein